MISIEDEIENYAGRNFNASQQSQVFFALHNEKELQRRYHEMENLQKNIEIILKKVNK